MDLMCCCMTAKLAWNEQRIFNHTNGSTNAATHQETRQRQGGIARLNLGVIMGDVWLVRDEACHPVCALFAPRVSERSQTLVRSSVGSPSFFMWGELVTGRLPAIVVSTSSHGNIFFVFLFLTSSPTPPYSPLPSIPSTHITLPHTPPPCLPTPSPSPTRTSWRSLSSRLTLRSPTS
jgi:hypothetical protein